MKDFKDAIRLLLKATKVKLWLEPYSMPDGLRGQRPEDLIKEYSEKLQLQEAVVEEIIEDLRVHSFGKFSARNKFADTGIATFYLKIVSLIQAEENDPNRYTNETIEMTLRSLGSDLRREISEKINRPLDSFRLICSGRNVEDDLPLEDSHVMNLSNILVLCLSDEENEVLNQLAQARKAAKLMADGDIYELQLTDQSGKPIQIPEQERKALYIAMMMHEKGRTAMKKGNYSLALVYLLEADGGFANCNSNLLENVDNFALLCLDVVWCYFHLRQVESLPEAGSRLNASEVQLRKSYGHNLERVTRVRGGSSKELAIMARLHLMQGVLHFYNEKYQESASAFNKTEQELKQIHVDETAFLRVMELGFGARQARLALRFCNGDISRAVEHIMQEREMKKIQKEQRLQQATEGSWKTLSGLDINRQLYHYLASMGFNKGAALEALKRHNNDMNMAIEYLHQHPLLVLPDPKQDEPKILPREVIDQLVVLGLTEEICSAAMDEAKSLEELVTVLKGVSGNDSNAWEASVTSILQGVFAERPMSSSQPSSPSSEQQKAEDRKLVDKEMVEDMSRDHDDYLDYTLEEENTILNEFKARLASIGHQRPSP